MPLGLQRSLTDWHQSFLNCQVQASLQLQGLLLYQSHEFGAQPTAAILCVQAEGMYEAAAEDFEARKCSFKMQRYWPQDMQVQQCDIKEVY